MRIFLLFLLFSLAFAQPPIDNVMDNNEDYAPNLENVYNASFAQNGTMTVTFDNSSSRDIALSASMQVAGMNLMIDNMTYPHENLSLILARGENASHLKSLPEDGYIDFICDKDWFYGSGQYPHRCDFDNDNCAEFENDSFVEYDTNVTFTFNGVNETVRTSSNMVQVPSEILDAMEHSSGADLLNVSIVSAALFTTIFNDRGFAGMDCTSYYVNVTQNVTLHLNASFPVAGAQKLFFLRSPVLNEQWHRNNQFNLIVMSQSPLYYAETYLNGNQTKNYTLREFNTTNNSFNLTEIVSNKTIPKGWSENINLTTPIPLSETDDSYSYIYGFNSTYSGLGKNTLGMLITDSFMGEAEYETVILSRMLSYNGTKNEFGEDIDPSITRPSSGFQKGQVSNVEIGLGFLAVIVMLTFVNFWLKKS
jgi:hypothetical protein